MPGRMACHPLSCVDSSLCPSAAGLAPHTHGRETSAHPQGDSGKRRRAADGALGGAGRAPGLKNLSSLMCDELSKGGGSEWGGPDSLGKSEGGLPCSVRVIYTAFWETDLERGAHNASQDQLSIPYSTGTQRRAWQGNPGVPPGHPQLCAPVRPRSLPPAAGRTPRWPPLHT